MQFRVPFCLLLLLTSLLVGCTTTTSLTASDVNLLSQSSKEGALLLSIGRRERPFPYLPVVYYKVLSFDSFGKINVAADLKSEVMDLRYFNGSHFFGAGKESVVQLLRIPAGTYWLLGYERARSVYIPIAGAGALTFPVSSAKVHILYRVEVFPGKLSYGGELITNSDILDSNASVTVSDEFDRDIEFVTRENPYIRSLPTKKSIAVPQE